MKRRSLFSSLALSTLVFAATSCLTSAWAQTTPTVAQRVASLDHALAGAKNGFVLIDDILYPVAELRALRNRIANTKPSTKSSSTSSSITLQSTFVPTEIWEGGNVPYEIDPKIAPVFRENFLNAARQWEAAANLRFYPRTTERDYIYVYTDPSGGSFSLLGRKPNSGFFGGDNTGQPLSLGFGNEIVAAHEIAHALGVEHEQSRSDRDEFVIINFDNIQPFFYNQYEKLDTSFNKGPYDFESCMHYFSINSGFAIDPSKETITTRLRYRAFQNIIGQRERISEGDKRGMALVYGLPTTDTPDPTPVPEATATPVPVATARPAATSTPSPPVEVAVPDNDNFANARPIDGESGEEFGDNLGATPESGEPQHAGASPTRSVWFRWTAPSSGIYAFATEGSRFDTVLAVYTGTAVSQLTRIAQDDDSGPTTRSLMQFNAQAGTTYFIVLDGFGVGRGEYQLTWRKVSDAPAPTPVPPLCQLQPCAPAKRLNPRLRRSLLWPA
jgi:hypothetical protein